LFSDFKINKELHNQKNSKHSKIELLAKTELNSIEEKFTKAIKDGEITDEEFDNIEQKIKNYENMKSVILNEYKVNKNLIDKFRTDVLRFNKNS